MREDHVWNRAKDVKIQTTPDIVGNFSIGFDSKISEETKDVLMRFVYWVEDNFNLPITLWVDFKYRHYLIRDGKRVGYKFYWANFKSYPVFDNPDDIPVIELPVRTGHRTNEEILKSFIKGITQYYMWLMGFEITDANEDEVDEVLQAYLQEKRTYQMKLNPGPYRMIAGGQKTIELRLNDPKRQSIRVGDHIIFTNTESSEQLTAKVIALHSFADFASLYKTLPLEKCGYLPEELATASYKDMEAYYTPAQQAEHGVLGIEIQLV